MFRRLSSLIFRSSRKSGSARKAVRGAARAARSGWLRRLLFLSMLVGTPTALFVGVAQVPASLLDRLPAEVRQGVRQVQHGVGEVYGMLEPVVSGVLPAGRFEDLSDLLAAVLPEGWRPSVEPVPPGALPKTATNWASTRRTLYEQVYFDRRKTFYCGCAYGADSSVNLDSCGLSSLITQSRALRVEAEHVFPASQFGNFRRCWREPERFNACRDDNGKVLPGRECCMRTDPTFVTAHNDLHNLYPAVGYINAQRSNHNWGSVNPFAERYGQCEMRISPWQRRAEPPESTRGAIARTMLYMRDTYGFRLSQQDEQLYHAWNNQHPPDDWERLRNRRIRALQGLGNHYIESYRRLP